MTRRYKQTVEKLQLSNVRLSSCGTNWGPLSDTIPQTSQHCWQLLVFGSYLKSFHHPHQNLSHSLRSWFTNKYVVPPSLIWVGRMHITCHHPGMVITRKERCPIKWKTRKINRVENDTFAWNNTHYNDEKIKMINQKTQVELPQISVKQAFEGDDRRSLHGIMSKRKFHQRTTLTEKNR